MCRLSGAVGVSTVPPLTVPSVLAGFNFLGVLLSLSTFLCSWEGANSLASNIMKAHTESLPEGALSWVRARVCSPR